MSGRDRRDTMVDMIHPSVKAGCGLTAGSGYGSRPIMNGMAGRLRTVGTAWGGQPGRGDVAPVAG